MSTATVTESPSSTARSGTDPQSEKPLGGRFVAGAANYIDERTSLSGLVKELGRKIFPDHWSFMLGEIALWSFVAVLLSVWIGLNMSVGAIEYKDVGFTIEDDGHATVTFQASVPEGVQAECDVLVTDSHAAPVGFRTVRLETLPADRRDSPSDAQQRYTVDVRTVVRGDSGVVETCRKV